MTDPEDKKGPPEAGGTPSTLEKAVAKASREREAEAEAAEQEAQGPASPGEARDDDPPGDAPPRRPVGRRVAGVLAFLLVFAIAYIARPLWVPVLPDWMQASLAPIMEDGAQDPEVRAEIASLAAKIGPLENEISALKAEFTARPATDPARLLALDDLVKQHGERLAAVKTQMDMLQRGAGDSDGGARLASLTKRVDDLQRGLAVLAARPADTGGSDSAAVAITAIDQLRSRTGERMTALEQENVALREIVAALDKRVGAIEEKPPVDAGPTRSNALVLAVGQLREEARGTAPFDVALQAVEVLADSDESLAKPLAALKPHAATGVPDLIALRIRFNRIAGRIAHESFVPKGEGLIEKTLGKVSRIFTFRRTGVDAATSDDENGRVARAELRLASGDLEAAVAVLEGLKEPGITYAAPWLKDARARLEVDAAIKALFSAALARARVPADGRGAPGG